MFKFLRDNPEFTLIAGGILILLACVFLVGVNLGLVGEHDRVMRRIEATR